jgi:hypothetical protein
VSKVDLSYAVPVINGAAPMAQEAFDFNVALILLIQ